MATGNPFYVQPAGDMTRGLDGIGKALAYRKEEKRLQAEKDTAEEQQRQMQAEYQEAYASGDPNALFEFSVKYPAMQETANQMLGLREDYQKEEAQEFRRAILSNPENAQQIFEERLRRFESQPNRNPENTQYSYDMLMSGDREGAIKSVRDAYILSDPKAYKEFMEATQSGQEWEEIKGQNGEIIGQRSRVTGEVKSDPRAQDATTTLTSEQKAGLGFPEDAVVQEGADGAYKIAYNPKDQSPDQRRQKIANLMSQGLGESVAANITDGIVEIEIVPDTGMARLINNITGEVRDIPIQSAGDVSRVEIPVDQQLSNLVDDATGLRSGALALSSRVPGTETTPEEEKVLNARNQFQTFENELARGLVNNPRFPVGERNAVLQAVDISPKIFDTPSALRVRLASTKNFLQTRYEQSMRDASDARLPEDVRSAQASNASAMRNAIDRIGYAEIDYGKEIGSMSKPELRELVNDMSEAELDALPEETRNMMLKALQ